MPLIFPAVKLHDGWHGDGGIRSIAPLSPAMHLGAKRIIAISTRFQGGQASPEQSVIKEYVPAAQIIGILLDSIFLDLLDYDAANMNRISELYEEISEEWKLTKAEDPAFGNVSRRYSILHCVRILGDIFLEFWDVFSVFYASKLSQNIF